MNRYEHDQMTGEYERQREVDEKKNKQVARRQRSTAISQTVN